VVHRFTLALPPVEHVPIFTLNETNLGSPEAKSRHSHPMRWLTVRLGRHRMPTKPISTVQIRRVRLVVSAPKGRGIPH
jgi:hypothetical protein